MYYISLSHLLWVGHALFAIPSLCRRLDEGVLTALAVYAVRLTTNASPSP